MYKNSSFSYCSPWVNSSAFQSSQALVQVLVFKLPDYSLLVMIKGSVCHSHWSASFAPSDTYFLCTYISSYFLCISSYSFIVSHISFIFPHIPGTYSWNLPHSWTHFLLLPSPTPPIFTVCLFLYYTSTEKWLRPFPAIPAANPILPFPLIVFSLHLHISSD